MSLIPPEVIIPDTADAVIPAPTRVRVCVFPRILEFLIYSFILHDYDKIL